MRKNQYKEKKRNNGNVSPSPQILEKRNFLQVNNQLNLPSSSSSSSSTSSNSFSSFSFNYSSSCSIFTPLPSSWTEDQMREYISEKIIKDRTKFMERDGGKDFAKYSNKDVMLEKLKEFKQIQQLRKNYDPKTLKYYLPHLFKVDNDNRPDYTVAIPWFLVDCFDFVE
jgi:hypothetical protein